jgi:hypothetical protein
LNIGEARQGSFYIYELADKKEAREAVSFNTIGTSMAAAKVGRAADAEGGWEALMGLRIKPCVTNI